MTFFEKGIEISDKISKIYFAFVAYLIDLLFRKQKNLYKNYVIPFVKHLSRLN